MRSHPEKATRMGTALGNRGAGNEKERKMALTEEPAVIRGRNSSGIRHPLPPAPESFGLGSWATDPRLSLEEKILRWHFFVLMRQRDISWQDLADELGVTKVRVGQMMKNILSEKVHLRLESAIDAITERRHAAVHTDDDPSCAVYTVSSEDPLNDDARLIEAKKGAMEQWREGIEHGATLTPTA